MAVLPAVAVAATTLSWFQLALTGVALSVFYWHWYSALQRYQPALLLSLNDSGELYWSGNALPAGRLCQGGLVSQWLLRLSWQSSDGSQQFNKWIFADQCSGGQYRALARALNQRNWPSQDAGN